MNTLVLAKKLCKKYKIPDANVGRLNLLFAGMENGNPKCKNKIRYLIRNSVPECFVPYFISKEVKFIIIVDSVGSNSKQTWTTKVRMLLNISYNGKSNHTEQVLFEQKQAGNFKFESNKSLHYDLTTIKNSPLYSPSLQSKIDMYVSDSKQKIDQYRSMYFYGIKK